MDSFQAFKAPDPRAEVSDDFRRELAALLNRHNKESGSDTPDFLLADYLIDCLRAFNMAAVRRERWHA